MNTQKIYENSPKKEFKALACSKLKYPYFIQSQFSHKIYKKRPPFHPTVKVNFFDHEFKFSKKYIGLHLQYDNFLTALIWAKERD